MPEKAITIWVDGPSGSPQQPEKSKIRAWGAWLEDMIVAFQSAGGTVYATRAEIYASLSADPNAQAWVMSDPTPAYNGIYRKVGSSGTGSWSRIADLPYSFIRLSNSGAGTANAIKATSVNPLPGASSAAILVMEITATNTAAVTLAANGATAKPLRTASGNDLAAGYLAVGMIVAFLDDGTSFRLLSDVASQAIQTAAEAARDEAASSATSALASKNAAATSATNAGNSATAAAGSAASALASKNAAATSEGNASASATAAAGSASAANTSKVNAAASATAAAGSATTATTKASEAASSASNASGSADAAAGSASAASNSATAAAGSASSASTSATNANSSKTAAATSATNAANSATAAATSASQASTSKTDAANSATAAETSKTDAATSASATLASKNAASTSETNAASSKTAAATSASAASTSATNASTSATSAQKWATEAEDIPVQTGLFSAFHWAKKAAALVTGGFADAIHAAAAKATPADADELAIVDSAASWGLKKLTWSAMKATLIAQLKGTSASTFAIGNDTRLSNAREWTAATVSQAEAEAGTATDRRAWTAELVKQSAVAQISKLSVGIGQTWADVTASRSAGTTYQNTTGKPIFAMIGCGSGNPGGVQVSADGTTWIDVGNARSSGTGIPTALIVPDTWRYRAISGTDITRWAELR